MNDLDEPITRECFSSHRFAHAGCAITLECSFHPEDGRVNHVSACAVDRGESVASVDGYFAHQGSFYGPDDFVDTMDEMSQETYDVAEFVVNLGPPFWRRRAGVLFFDDAATDVSHRRRGLVSAMSRAAVAQYRQPRHPLLVVVQPWPSEFALKGTDHDGTRPVLTPSQWKREMTRVTSIWLRIFPWLNNSGIGGLNGERVYHYGFAP